MNDKWNELVSTRVFLPLPLFFFFFPPQREGMNDTTENEMGDLLVNALFWYKFKSSVQFSILYLFLPSWYYEWLLMSGIYLYGQKKNKIVGPWREQ